MPEFAAMTVDELIAWRVAKKAEITALREELRASNEIYHTKVAADRMLDRLRAADFDGATIETMMGALGLATIGGEK
jgi:hypothetical protein